MPRDRLRGHLGDVAVQVRVTEVARVRCSRERVDLGGEDTLAAQRIQPKAEAAKAPGNICAKRSPDWATS